MIQNRDIFKLFSVIILTFCTVFICSIFINLNFDLRELSTTLTDPAAIDLCDAQLIMSAVIIACSGGVLGLVTLTVLIFSIGKYISNNHSTMGILKALGYDENQIAVHFIKFGLSVLVGSLLGYLFSFLFSSLFYDMFSGEGLLNLQFKFNWETALIVIIFPFIFFSTASFIYARIKLKKSALQMINNVDKMKINRRNRKMQLKNPLNRDFLKSLKSSTLNNNLLLIFFVGFAAFGFSAQIQMAFSMNKVTEGYTMSITLVLIGILLGCVTLMIAFSFVFKSNMKYMALLKAYGYSEVECNKSLFGGYRIVAYIGFFIGTFYQFFLIKMMLQVFETSFEIPVINFHFIGFIITLIFFIIFYEILMLFYKKRISKLSLKSIMTSQ